MGGGQGCSSIKQSQQEVALQGACYIPFTLSEAENLNHDVMRFRFSLQSDQHVSGVPVGNHITLKYKDESGQNILRSYTPVSSGCGFIDIIVKIYQRTEKYPEGGSMTQHLASMMLGDTVLIKGPMGDFEYLGKGQMSISDAVINKNKIGLIAGGSGIAPLLQILRAIRSNVNDQTEIWLIFANRTEHDLFLREELDDYLAKEPNKFHVHYILSKPSIEWESKIVSIVLPTHSSTHTYTYAYTCTYGDTYTYAYTHAYTYTLTHAHTHTYAYIHVYTHIDTCIYL